MAAARLKKPRLSSVCCLGPARISSLLFFAGRSSRNMPSSGPSERARSALYEEEELREGKRRRAAGRGAGGCRDGIVAARAGLHLNMVVFAPRTRCERGCDGRLRRPLRRAVWPFCKSLAAVASLKLALGEGELLKRLLATVGQDTTLWSCDFAFHTWISGLRSSEIMPSSTTGSLILPCALVAFLGNVLVSTTLRKHQQTAVR